MNKIYFVFWLLVSLAYMYILLMGVPWSDQPTALGKLVNPYSGFWQNAESVNSIEDFNLESAALKGSVSVHFDQRMVPHQYGDHVSDHAFVLGFLHAKFRLWQMDVAVRAASGRLSEILGNGQINHDRIQRRKGLGPAAKQIAEFWKKDTEGYEMLSAYINGVNTYIDQLTPATYPLEFKLLSYEPENWTAEHTAYMVLSMAETLAQKAEDAQRNNIRHLFGDSIYHHFFAEYSEFVSPVIPTGAGTFSTVQSEDTMQGLLYNNLTPSIPDYEEPEAGLGSNSWAIAGEKTKAGYPLLANDPHLKLNLPSIWFECQWKTPDFHVHGVSIPGLPGIVIGFNEYHAWGITNVAHDVLDWYAIKWANDEKTAYLVDDESFPVEWVYEEIKVKGQPTVIDSVRYTQWGPVVYEGSEDFREGLAMRWLAHEPKTANDFLNYLRAMQGKSYGEFRKGFEVNEIPANNYTYASVTDTIGMLIGGKLPLRAGDEATRIRDGSDSREAWKGFVPKDSIPEMLNPTRNFVSSANQRSTGDDYPYKYSGYFYHFRGNYINRLLLDMTGATVEDMQDMQLDNYSIFAEEALPAMLSLCNQFHLSEDQLYWLDALAAWNYHFDGDLKQPAIFQLWWNHLKDMLWDEFQTENEERQLLIPTDWRTIEFLVNEQDHPFWDRKSTDTLETASDIITLAFVTAMNELEESLAEEDFSWTKYKSFSIKHIGQIAAFSSPVLAVGGHIHSLNSIRDIVGPSWRMVVALDKSGPHATVVYPGGQSGNPGSFYYDNMLNHWVSGQYYTVRLIANPGQIENQIASYQFQAK
jgi:penicillin G amidase